MTAWLDDPAQQVSGSSAGFESMNIDWGDGSNSGGLGGNDYVTVDAATLPAEDMSHNYDKPGTYTMTAMSQYTEPEQSGGFWMYSSPRIIVVTEVTPTLTVSADTTATVTGDTYVLTPTYVDPTNDHPALNWTITWGDGTSDYYGPQELGGLQFSHVYNTASTSGTAYQPVVSGQRKRCRAPIP